MMNVDKEKWKDDVLDSLKGSKRAHLNPNLYAKIEQQVYFPESEVIKMHQWRMAVAAAVLFLFLNVFSMNQFVKSSQAQTDEISMEIASSEQIISNYNLYN